jgi:hypothetical protein
VERKRPGSDTVEFLHDLLLPLRQHILQLLLSLLVLLLVFVQLDLSNQTAPNMVLYFCKISLIKSPQIASQPAFVIHFVKHRF